MSRLDKKFNTFETITNTDDSWCVHNSFDNKNNLSKGDIHLISIAQTSRSYSTDFNTDLNVYYFQGIYVLNYYSVYCNYQDTDFLYNCTIYIAL